MKKFLLCLLLLPLTAYASKWVLITKSIKGDSFFIDSKSIVKNGNEVNYWILVNSNSRTEFGSLSNKVNETINCRTRELRVNYLMAYSDLNANGELISSYKTSHTWDPIPPDTVNTDKLNFVCKK